MAVTLSDLVSYWRMEEASGTRVDAHGSNDLSVGNGTPAAATGIQGNGVELDAASSEYLVISDASQTGLEPSTFTISCWIKLASLPSVTGNMTIIAKWDTKAYRIRLSSSSDRLIFEVSSDGTTTEGQVSGATFGALSAGVWYHVVAVVDGTNNYTYINTTSQSASYSNGIDDNAAGVAIGSVSATGSGSAHFDGIIDEVSFWNAAMSAEQVAAFYNSGAGLSYAETVALFGTPSIKSIDGRIGRVRIWDRSLNANELAVRQGGDSTHHVQIAADDDITEDLISLYKLEESITGQQRFDSWGPNHLASNNSVGAATGVLGTAAHFTRASNQFLSISDANLVGLDIIGPMTIAAFIRLDSLPSSAAANFVVVSKAAASNISYWLMVNTSNLVVFQVSADGSAATTITASTFGALSAGVWYFLCARWDGANLKLRVDATDQTPVAFAGPIFNGTAPFHIGAYGTPDSYFDGRIDQAPIWGRSLAEAEVTRLRGGGLGLDISALNYYRYGRLVAESGGAWASQIMDADYKALRRA